MKHVPVILLLAGLLSLLGCETKLGGPPLDVTYRDSLVGAGKIVRIANTTNEALGAMEIEITSPDGDSRTYSHPALGAYETLEVGWKKLGGWQVVDGAKVGVRIEGYLFPHSSRLAAEPSPTGADAKPDRD